MSATLNSLLPLLGWLAGAGSGVLASWLFDLLRNNAPDWLYTFLAEPLYARYASLALSVFIALAAVSGAALIRGDVVLNAIDATLASIVAAQLRHAHLNFTGQRVTFEPDFDDDEEGE